MSLYHAAFGFTSAYRNAIVRKDIAGITAQLVMIGLAMLMFAPFLASGEAFGRPIGGAVAPAGVRVAIGSFVFGLGMQLGSGCGSGTLYTVGGGSTRMIVTLIAFCTGAFLGSLDSFQLPALPSLGAVSFGKTFGWPLAIFLANSPARSDLVRLPLVGGCPPAKVDLGGWPERGKTAARSLATSVQRRHARRSQPPDPVRRRPPLDGHVGFHLMGGRGRPDAFGWDPASTSFWSGGFPGRALEGSLFQDNITLMNIGIMLGALIAAGAAGRFAPTLKIPFRSLLAAIIGGLLMGYGARLGFGCNIGAFFSGAASFSLHAWIWIACAFAGTWIGVKLRPWFGLPN